MIQERVNGQQLTGLKLSESSADLRRQFYVDLISILAQLRGLNFNAAGSLMPGQRKAFPMPRWLEAFSPEPVIVSAISMPINDMHVLGGCAISQPAPPTSTSGFVAQMHRLLRDIFLLPTQDLEEGNAQYEVFALHIIQQQQKQLLMEQYKSQPEQFVLTHTDLRVDNIMVDDQLRIQAIIDWEWAITVPSAFFTPPFWIMYSKDRLADFRSALASLPSGHGQSLALLQKRWLCSDDDDLALHIGHIFFNPYSIVQIFYDHIYPRLFKEPENETLRNFFICPQWQEEIRQRLQRSERYNQYLKANNLYKVDEERQRLHDLIAQGQALLSKCK